MKNAKAALRRRMRIRLSEIPKTEIARMSTSVTLLLTGLQQWNRAETVLVYLSMQAEVMTERLIELALTQGKRIGVPRVWGNELRFHRYHGKDQLVRRHRFGMNETMPDAEELIISPVEEDWQETSAATRIPVIVPGLAFDDHGNRLGRGKGYYDRFLGSRRERLCVIGVCFETQLCDYVPAASTDVKMDYIVTECRIIMP